ncbi:YqzL family protein [Paraliobacillus sp. JSM ZJ581]
MIDLSWRIFTKTGNIETYLLMKEIEAVYNESALVQFREVIKEYDQRI